MSSARDSMRKAEFREEARRIVQADRELRKHGRSVDTAGEIVRAMERAYKRGLRDGRSEDGPPREIVRRNYLEWIEIPPRPRSAFWSFCLWAVQRADQTPATVKLVWNGGRWLRVIKGSSAPRSDDTDSFGERTIAPLVKLGLLEQVAEGLELRLSDMGRRTWRKAVEEAENRGERLFP